MLKNLVSTPVDAQERCDLTASMRDARDHSISRSCASTGLWLWYLTGEGGTVKRFSNLCRGIMKYGRERLIRTLIHVEGRLGFLRLDPLGSSLDSSITT